MPGVEAKEAVGEELREGAVGGVGAGPGGEGQEVEEDRPRARGRGARTRRGAGLRAITAGQAMLDRPVEPGARSSSAATSGTRTLRISSLTRRKTGSASSPSPA